MSCASRQTQTLIGSVLRGSRTIVGGDRLTIGAVVLAGRIAGRGSDGHVDANRVIGNSSGRIEADSVTQKVSIAAGDDKYRNGAGSGHRAIAYKKKRDSSRDLAIGLYLSEQRSPLQIAGVGQADLPSGGGGEIRRQSSTIGIEDKIRRDRRTDVATGVGGSGPDGRNAIWVHGAAQRVRRLRPTAKNVNAVLRGSGRHAQQKDCSPEERQHQSFHLSPHSFAISRDGEADSRNSSNHTDCLAGK